MKLNTPKLRTWWIAVILAALGLVASLVTIPVLSEISFWLVVAGFVLLMLATMTKGL